MEKLPPFILKLVQIAMFAGGCAFIETTDGCSAIDVVVSIVVEILKMVPLFEQHRNSILDVFHMKILVRRSEAHTAYINIDFRVSYRLEPAKRRRSRNKNEKYIFISLSMIALINRIYRISDEHFYISVFITFEFCIGII